MVRYWAWKDYEDGDSYRHIYRAKLVVEMCSPDGFKEAEKEKRGKIVEVEVKEVDNDNRPGD